MCSSGVVPITLKVARQHQPAGPQWHRGDTHACVHTAVQGFPAAPDPSPVPFHIYCPLAYHPRLYGQVHAC